MYHRQRNGEGQSMSGSAPLEQQLRNMILSSSERDALPQALAGAAPGQGLTSPTGPAPSAVAAALQPALPPASPKSGRKRPNQAQRRQMSAQLSIPIDPMPIQSHSARNYASPPAYGPPHYQPQHHQHNHFYSQHSYQNQQQQQQQALQRPQSATLRPSHFGQGPMLSNARGSGPPYPSQPRHQQSLSYQGPTMYDDPYNWRSHQQAPPPFDASSSTNGRPSNNPNGRLYHTTPDELQAQTSFLGRLCEKIVASAEIEPGDIQEKEQFRSRIEQLCQSALAKYELEVNGRPDFPSFSVRLKCFGSLSSGFATKASDMDLGLISPLSIPLPDALKSPIPRLIEKAFLDAGLGARLLTRTRVPIIKLCELPPEQLRNDLLEERAKWERGLDPEHDGLEADEDAAEDAERPASQSRDAKLDSKAEDDKNEDTASEHAKTDNAKTEARHGRKESGPDAEHLDEDKHAQSLAHLKQPVNQSLGNYYAMTKRLLRKLGGHDITHSTAREFKDKDLKLVTDVGYAFVSGLADGGLKARLLASRSLATSFSPSQLNYRSLYGVFMQVEGERLAMLWDAREIHEKDARQEDEARDKIRAWKELQNKPGFAQDILGYSKEIQLALDGLRKIVSLQIVTLEQGLYEPPAQYHDRATKLLLYSGSRDTANPADPILPVIIRHYVAGIWNHEIRSQVETFATSIDKPSLRAVARRHKSLQLAVEFEKALGKGYYGAADVDDIKAYIDVLRMPLQKGDLPGRRFDYVLARTPETASIISRARQLPDPSKLAPNQPRDPYRDRLEFPKTGAGVQCDINFSAHLALQNTLLLRCYSHTDARVRPLVLFVKHWAKIRGINTPYRGTLSSYGYVLMVLHYLVNVAQPFVCPNLQQLARPVPDGLSPEEIEDTVTCRGRNVRFWRNEEEIKDLAAKGMLNQNKDSIGHLLRGFFEYYAQSNFMSTVPCRGFDWGRDVLSLRTPSGLRTKQEKGWTGARTIMEVQNQATTPASVDRMPESASPATDAPADGQGGTKGQAHSSPDTKPATMSPGKSPVASKAPEMKEVKHRYLFAIEDPFELDHNVARTVTHGGIVAIRDEFRRAWKIIKNVGRGAEENLLEDVADRKGKERDQFAELLNEIHGPELSLQ